MTTLQVKEGSLEAPTRYPLDWRNDSFYDEDDLNKELERVFDLCHGCRRCVNLCNAFPTLFDLVDESSTMEVDGVDKKDYIKVVDQCYLCDLCYETKCPYIPPHEWNIDFPHLMLRAKAIKFKQGKVKYSEKILASTDATGKMATIPIVVNVVNAASKSKPVRKVLDKALGVHPQALVPSYNRQSLKRNKLHDGVVVAPTEKTTGKIALFTTCYGKYNDSKLVEDLVSVLQHNGLQVAFVSQEKCCGMPKLELGDLQAVEAAKETNIPILAEMVDQGWDIMGIVPSCILMFRQELPLMFPQDEQVQKVANAMFDPFEYLMLREKEGQLNKAFKRSLGKVAYHVACHQRVQKIGMKTKECLQFIPDTEVVTIERCSGHDGTYGVKTKYYDAAKKIARPVARKIEQADADYHGSDCPLAGKFIAHVLDNDSSTSHPISLLRQSYDI